MKFRRRSRPSRLALPRRALLRRDSLPDLPLRSPSRKFSLNLLHQQTLTSSYRSATKPSRTTSTYRTPTSCTSTTRKTSCPTFPTRAMATTSPAARSTSKTAASGLRATDKTTTIRSAPPAMSTAETLTRTIITVLTMAFTFHAKSLTLFLPRSSISFFLDKLCLGCRFYLIYLR